MSLFVRVFVSLTRFRLLFARFQSEAFDMLNCALKTRLGLFATYRKRVSPFIQITGFLEANVRKSFTVMRLREITVKHLQRCRMPAIKSTIPHSSETEGH